MKNYYVKVLYLENNIRIEMKKIRKNKDPDTILNVSYREYIKPFTKVNTENIYLDNAFIQQVFIFLKFFNSSLFKQLCLFLVAGILLLFHIQKKHN